jgi:hypothetical protein
MRTIALSLTALAVVAAGAIVLAAEQTPLASIARLASDLSESDSDGALDAFDPQMKGYSEIEEKLEALTAQADVSCAIEVVSDMESEGVHKLDLDWQMQLKPQSDELQLERRRVRVQVEMRQVKGAWKITSFTPISVFDPLRIR